MGKARKHSRVKLSGFVPNYLRTIEPVEFAYSDRINSQMKHSEDSPPLKRRRFGLNGDSYGVRKEVLSLSQMSRSEGKNLVHKLKMELQQVRDLSKKIASFSSDTVLLSPYNDIQSCSDGPRRMPPEKFATFVGSQGKKRPPVRNDKQRTKKGPSQLDVPTSSTVTSLMKECETLLNLLWSHKLGWAFMNSFGFPAANFKIRKHISFDFKLIFMSKLRCSTLIDENVCPIISMMFYSLTLIVKANAGALTNFEVLDLLNSRGASKDTTRVIAPIARSEYKVYDYLVETAACTQTRESVNKFAEKSKDFKVAKAEILNIINLRPSSIVELLPIIEKPDDRGIDTDGILELVKDLLPPLPTTETHKDNDDEEETENGEQQA